MDRTLVDEIDEFLNHRGFSSWGESFDIIKADRRREAAKWFARQYGAFEAWRAGYHGDGTDPTMAEEWDLSGWDDYMRATDEHDMSALVAQLRGRASLLRRSVRRVVELLRRLVFGWA